MAGCSGKPSAPALTSDEEYYDSNAGIRFPTPPGFRMFIKAEMPKGKIDKPIMLAAFQDTKAKIRTAIEVMAVDISDSQDLGQYLKTNPVGSEKWETKPPAQSIEVGGQPAVRLEYVYHDEDRDHAREVTAVRWGGRAYFVIVIYPPDNPAARDAGRAMLDKVRWMSHD